MTFEQKTMLYI